MNTEDRMETEVLEVAELEYEVGAVGAVEASETQVNQAANLVIRVLPLK